MYSVTIIIMAVQMSGCPEYKNKSFGWAGNRNQPQHRLKFVVTIIQQFVQLLILLSVSSLSSSSSSLHLALFKIHLDVSSSLPALPPPSTSSSSSS